VHPHLASTTGQARTPENSNSPLFLVHGQFHSTVNSESRRHTMKRMTMLDMTREGKIIERHPENDSEGVLDGTLLNRLYPNIHVAMVSLPQGFLEISEESEFSVKFDLIEHNGVRYQLAGGSGSVKNRKYYFVDEDHRDLITERFQRWPEALITYFGILVSPCKSIVQDNIGMMVVQDRTYGTNADRAWFSARLFQQFGLLPRRFYQFRMGFLEKMQAKGSFKVMDDNVAEFLGVDIILPESCIKPASNAKISEEGFLFQTEVTSGIREVSRLLTFESSYTLIVHAPRESVEQEIIPEARVMIGKVNAAFTERNHPALVELLGRRVPDDLDKEEEKENEKSPERTVEAVLLADGSGELTQHPYIHQQLDKMLAHWAYKTLTGGGLELPAFALADDGYLFLHQGRLCGGSDWLPLDTAITSISSPYGLCVRYPIRMREDLLPLLHLHGDGVAEKLIEIEGIDRVEAYRIARDQICLQGVYVLNSETAKRFAGDFDFDLVNVVDGDRYERFVAWRFNLNERPPIEKDKQTKAHSPWFNFADTAIEAGGNKIGLITNLKASCVAAGREDLEYELVGEQQNEIDSLKWGVRANMNRIKEIQKEVPMAPWLPLKWAEKISEFPDRLEVLPTDVIGNMYNELRPDIKTALQEPLPIRFYKGLIKGNNPTLAMIREARMINAMYGAAYQPWLAGIEKAQLRLDQAEKRYNAVKAETDEELARLKSNGKAKTKGGQKASDQHAEIWEKRNNAYDRMREARAKYQDAIEHCRSKASQLARVIRDWGNGKTENRRAWAEAVHQSACRGKGKGSVLFLAFPQETVDMIAERTAGIRTEVYTPKNGGAVIVERDRLYEVTDKGRHKFVMRYESHTRTVHWRNN
jgi:hypothetical protein